MLPKIETHTPSKTENLHVLVYGRPMIGKTTFASTFPKPLIISTDGNTNKLNATFGLVNIASVNDYKTSSNRIIKLDGWSYFKKIIEQLRSEEHGYQTIVIDSLYDLYNMCFEHWNKKNAIEYAGDLAFARGWVQPRTDFFKQLSELRNITLTTNLVAIVPHKENENGTITQIFTDKVWSNIARLFSMVTYIETHNNKITLFIKENRMRIPVNAFIAPTHSDLVQVVKACESKQIK